MVDLEALEDMVEVDLVEYPCVPEMGLQVRAGLGYGSVLAIGGDYSAPQ